MKRDSVFATIVRHEWRTLAADRTAWAVLLLFAGSIAYAVSHGAAQVAERRAEIGRAAAQERDRLAADRAEALRSEAGGATAGEASPFSVGPAHPYYLGTQQGTLAFLHPAPLASLALGQLDLHPYGYRVTTGNRESLAASEPLENPLTLYNGHFDLAFVLIYLYPLLIITLSFNLVSGEREGGTLGLLLSQPLALQRLILSKVALRALLVLGAVGAFSVIAALAAGLEVAAPGAQPRLSLWLLAVLGYGAFWFTLALWINAWGRSSAANAVILASAWLVLVVLIPGTIDLAATTFFPVPSRVELVNAVREASDTARVQGSRLLGKFFEDHPQLAGGGASQLGEPSFMVLRLARDEAVGRSLEPVHARYEGALARQRRLVDRFRFLSPALLLQDAMLESAGTGASRHQRFLRAVDAFGGRWRQFFAPRYVGENPVFTAADYDRLPRFELSEEPAVDVARRAALPLAALALLPLALGVAGLLAYRKFPLAG